VRTALISDVHANVVALRAVMEDIDRSNVQTIVNAGDIVGYYPFPNETIDLLKERKVLSIRGNHDRSVLSANTNRMNMIASAAVQWTVDNMKAEGLDYLDSLPDSRDFNIGTLRASVHHGSPSDEDEYTYENDVTDGLLGLCPGSKLLVLGHTHVPFIVHLTRGHVVNPGSVGQPRDGDPRASYMVYDSTKDMFEAKRVEYDISAVEEAVLSAGLPKQLASRLWEGL
jgi:putative phosphoesterase